MTMPAGRCRDIAHVSAVELRTQVPEMTVDFFVRLLGLSEVAREGDRVWLRTWDDYERFTVCVVGGPASGIGRTWMRAASPEALARRVAAIEAAGLRAGLGRRRAGHRPGVPVQGPGRSRDGRVLGDRVVRAAPEGQRPALKNQAAPFPGRGACVRRLDHVNYLAADIPAVTRFLPERARRPADRADRHR